MWDFFVYLLNTFMYSLSFLSPITFRGFDSFIGGNLNQIHIYMFVKLFISIFALFMSSFILLTTHKHQLEMEKKYIFNYERKYTKLNRFFALSLLCIVPNIFIYSLNLKIWNANDYLFYLLSLLILLLLHFVLLIKRKYYINNFSIFDSIIVFAISILFSIMGTWNFVSIILIYMYILGYRLNKISLFVCLIIFFNSLSYIIINITDIKYFNIYAFLSLIIVIPSMMIQYLIIFKMGTNIRKWFTSILFITIITTYMIYI